MLHLSLFLALFSDQRDTAGRSWRTNLMGNPAEEGWACPTPSLHEP